MNSIALVPTSRWGSTYYDIVIDGKSLEQHFVGPQDEHLVSSVGRGDWASDWSEGCASVAAQFLREQALKLESGQVPVLICGECRDFVCGSFAVLILKEGDRMRWTNWSYYTEGVTDDSELAKWPIRPGDFIFDLQSYEAVFREWEETWLNHGRVLVDEQKRGSSFSHGRVQVNEQEHATTIRIVPLDFLFGALLPCLGVTSLGGLAAGLIWVLIVENPEGNGFWFQLLWGILIFTVMGLAVALWICMRQVPRYLRHLETDVFIDQGADTLRINKRGWGSGTPTSESISFSSVKSIWFDRLGEKFLIGLDLDRPDRNRTFGEHLGEDDFKILRLALVRGLKKGASRTPLWELTEENEAVHVFSIFKRFRGLEEEQRLTMDKDANTLTVTKGRKTVANLPLERVLNVWYQAEKGDNGSPDWTVGLSMPMALNPMKREKLLLVFQPRGHEMEGAAQSFAYAIGKAIGVDIVKKPLVDRRM